MNSLLTGDNSKVSNGEINTSEVAVLTNENIGVFTGNVLDGVFSEYHALMTSSEELVKLYIEKENVQYTQKSLELLIEMVESLKISYLKKVRDYLEANYLEDELEAPSDYEEWRENNGLYA